MTKLAPLSDVKEHDANKKGAKQVKAEKIGIPEKLQHDNLQFLGGWTTRSKIFQVIVFFV